MNEGTAMHRAVWTAAKDTVPDSRHDSATISIGTVSHMHKSITLYTAKRFIVRSLRPHTTITTGKYLSKDVTANDIDERLSIGMLVSNTRDIHILYIEDRPTHYLLWIRTIRIRLIANICHITTAIHRAEHLCLSWDCDRCSAMNTRHILEVGESAFNRSRLHTSTTTKYIAIDIAAISKNCCITAYLTKVFACLTSRYHRLFIEILVCLQLTISSTEYTVHIGIATDFHIRVSLNETCIATADHTKNGEACNTIAIVIYTDCCLISTLTRRYSLSRSHRLRIKGESSWLCKLLFRSSTLWSIIVNTDIHLGRTNGCVCTITTTKYIEVRVLIVVIGILPDISRKDIIITESPCYINSSNTRFLIVANS